MNDEICKGYGIDNQKITKQKGEVVSFDKNKYQIIKKGANSTRLAENIIKNMQTSTSKENFILSMQKIDKENYQIFIENNKSKK